MRLPGRLGNCFTSRCSNKNVRHVLQSTARPFSTWQETANRGLLVVNEGNLIEAVGAITNKICRGQTTMTGS
jgi:hypothetical protein